MWPRGTRGRVERGSRSHSAAGPAPGPGALVYPRPGGRGRPPPPTAGRRGRPARRGGRDKSLCRGLTFNRSQRGSCSATYETLTQNQVVYE